MLKEVTWEGEVHLPAESVFQGCPCSYSLPVPPIVDLNMAGSTRTTTGSTFFMYPNNFSLPASIGWVPQDAFDSQRFANLDT